MDKPKQSFTVSLVVTNTWTWKGRTERKAMQVPMPPASVGVVSNVALVWGCFALTFARSAVVNVQGGLVVPAPAGGLVDARGQLLGRP